MKVTWTIDVEAPTVEHVPAQVRTIADAAMETFRHQMLIRNTYPLVVEITDDDGDIWFAQIGMVTTVNRKPDA